jgi:hypothetical protein
VSVLENEFVREQLRQAWQDSCPAATDAHEEGGFILKDSEGVVSIERWPGGIQDEIVVPPHAGGTRNGLVIVATFHTHPNWRLNISKNRV